MNTRPAIESLRPRLDALRSAPPEIVLYGLFALVVSAADMWLTFVGPRSVKEWTVPFTGWVASMPYLFGFFWIYMLIFGRNRERMGSRWGLVGPLLVCVVFGVVEYARRSHGPDFNNPYLRVSVWQPLWTVALPALWTAVLLLAPRVRRHKAVVARPLSA